MVYPIGLSSANIHGKAGANEGTGVAFDTQNPAAVKAAMETALNNMVASGKGHRDLGGTHVPNLLTDNVSDLNKADAKTRGNLIDLANYARASGRHIRPGGSLDLKGIAKDPTAPANVQRAASDTLKDPEASVLARVGTAANVARFQDFLTVSAAAHKSGQHIRPDRSIDWKGVANDYTMPLAAREAAKELLAHHYLLSGERKNTVSSTVHVRKPTKTSPTDVVTAPITVSTFNTRYDQGKAAVVTLNRIAPQNDIILLQEVEPQTLTSVTSNLFDTHAPYLGEANEHGWQGEFDPIYYNKKRFEAVYTDHIQLNEQGDLGAGSARDANFVLLKDRQTGATVLVSNTHLDNFSEASRQAGIEKIKAKVASIKAQYPVDSVISGGDFNLDPNSAAATLGLQGANYSPNNPTFKAGGNIDGILVSDRDAGTVASDYRVTDGGASDHNIVSRSVKVTAHVDVRKAALRPANFGAIVYDAINYGGDAWITGFGTSGPINTKWNDRISSVRVGDGTVLTARTASDRDPAHNTPINKTTVLTGDVPWVGTDVNDTFSSLGLSATPPV